MSEPQLPPQPKPAEFMHGETFLENAYKRALESWRQVCREVLAAQRANEF